MSVIASEAKTPVCKIQNLRELGGGDDRNRLAVVEIEGAWPPEVRAHLEREGCVVAGPSASGRRSTFAAALVRWPPNHLALGEALGGRMGLDVRPFREVVCGKWRLPVGERTVIMGILNVTPDSFYDGGRYVDPSQAVERAKSMVAEGADIIDVGGESTRPNATPVPEDVEMERVLPVIRALVAEVDVPISIDTYKATVAEAALKAGATMINDITGLHHDPRMARVAAEYDAAVVVMHIKGQPRTMQVNPVYDDVVAEVRAYLGEGCEKALKAGVKEDRIWVDPGIGFGKRVEHNLELLRELRAMRTLGFPVLIGTSNKSIIGHVLDLPVDDRLEGTAATVSTAVAFGADGVRVHDVRVMRRVADMTDAIVRKERGSA